MLLKQISVFLENKQGSLADVTKCLYEKGINILALSIADTTDFGILRLIVSNPDDAKQALLDDGNAVTVTDVVAIEVGHTPGSLYNALKLLYDEQIAVEYTYAFVGVTEKSTTTNKASVILKTSDLNKTVDLLNAYDGAEVLRAQDLGNA